MSSNHENRALLPLRSALTTTIAVCGTLVLLATGACDSTATLFPQRINFQRAMVVSAYPAVKQTDGSWRRQCAPGQTDGLITNLALISTQRNVAGDVVGREDKDLSIRPGDVISARVVEGGLPDDINLSATGNLTMALECIEPQPPRGTGNDCQSRGGVVPSATIDAMRYVSHTDRRRGHNVLVLVDQSGSIAGLVDPDNGNIEARPGDFQPPPNFGDLGSDRSNVRLAATKRFITSLNFEDRYGVMAFGESLPLRVPCSEALGDVSGDLDLCFGKPNSAIWLAPTGIDSLIGQPSGRSNLWQAVDTAYTYLKGLDDRVRSNHIVVVTDGPDTCSQSENRGACQSACSSTDHQSVLARIEADQANPNAVPIQVHFVQFESLGYPGRDPRQVEVACVSGGQYQYVNSNLFPRAQPTQFQEAIETALINVRYMLMGHWELAADVPSYTSDAGAPTGTVRGSLYALSGLFTLRASSNMVTTDRPFPFDVGQGEQASSATQWDRRPVVRKPCTAQTDCGAAPGAGGPCTIICSDETLTCPGNPPAVGTTAPDTYACDLPGGGNGFCCEGACEPIGTVCSACQ